MLPGPLQHEGAQGLRILPIGVERLHRRQEGLVREALADRQHPLRRLEIILPQVGDQFAQRLVERHAALFNEPQDRRRGEDDLRQRCEIEHRLASHRRLCGLQLGVTCDRDRAITRGIDDAENRARNARIGNCTANGLERAISDVLRRHVR